MPEPITGDRVALAGQEHAPLAGEQQLSATVPQSVVRVTLLLRRRSALPHLHQEFGARHPQQRRHFSHAELEDAHGATHHDLTAIERFAAAHGLQVVFSSRQRRTVVLEGAAQAIETAFGVTLVEMQHERGAYRAAQGTPSVPRELDGVVLAVLGMNTRPCTRRRVPVQHDSSAPLWTLPQMAEAYGFSSTWRAEGQRIALIELGGGYHPQDVAQFFASLGRPVPVIREVCLGGATNTPAAPEDIAKLLDVIEGRVGLADVPADVLSAAQCTAEVTMDIELSAALAPGAEIVVYFAPGDEQGIHDALSAALHAPEGPPAAISFSWGEPETGVASAYLTAIEDVLHDAAALGVTVCASSGDQGAMNGAQDSPTVNFPASSPHVLACGGSSAHHADGQFNEVVWNCTGHGIAGASGGGVSRNFPLPEWQQPHGVPASPAGAPGRGVPDVAGPADPHHGCAIVVGGRQFSSAGTSAVAPMWAALIALLNHQLGARCGFITPLLYALAAQGGDGLRPITTGDNGFYPAAEGWNACTGLGSPVAHRLLHHLRPPA